MLDTEEFEFRFDCGITNLAKSVSLKDKEMLIHTFALHYSIIRVKAELDQFVKGLEIYKLTDLVNSSPYVFRQLLQHYKPMRFTADAIFDLFPPEFSPQGSNVRESEEEVIMMWVNYTQEIQGMTCIVMYI